MADDGPLPVKAEAFYGVIAGAAREHASTAQVWEAIHAEAAAQGWRVPPDLFRAVNEMRSVSVGLREASRHLGGAAASDAITGQMIGGTIYARDATARELAPLYHVRYQMTTLTNGVEVSNWYTLEYAGGLPGSVGDLREDVELVGSQLAESYGSTFGEIGDIEIGAF